MANPVTTPLEAAKNQTPSASDPAAAGCTIKIGATRAPSPWNLRSTSGLSLDQKSSRLQHRKPCSVPLRATATANCTEITQWQQRAVGLGRFLVRSVWS